MKEILVSLIEYMDLKGIAFEDLKANEIGLVNYTEVLNKIREELEAPLTQNVAQADIKVVNPVPKKTKVTTVNLKELDDSQA